MSKVNLKNLYKKLEKYHEDFNNWDNVMRFLGTAREIVDFGEIESFSTLLKYFDDNDYTDFVLEDLTDAIEGYKDDIYVKGILQNLEVMMPHAKEWATNLIVILFNSDKDIKILKKYIYLANEEYFLEILDMIDNRTEKHRSIIGELRKILRSQ